MTITNIDDIDAVVSMYLGFCRDGTDYKTMAGDINVPWSPWIALEDIGSKYKISRWKKDFILKCNPETKWGAGLFTFKLGSFPVDVNRFIADIKGWPFVWVTWRGLKQWHCRIQFEMESKILFTDNQPHGMSTKDMNDLRRDIESMKRVMYATGDAEMAQEAHQ